MGQRPRATRGGADKSALALGPPAL